MSEFIKIDTYREQSKNELITILINTFDIKKVIPHYRGTIIKTSDEELETPYFLFEIQEMLDVGAKLMKIVKRTPVKCPNCMGSGKIEKKQCQSCSGKGITHELYLSDSVNLEEIDNFKKMTEGDKLFPIND